MLRRTTGALQLLLALAIAACSDAGTPTPNPLPLVRLVSPAGVVVGSPGTAVTVTGSGFVRSSRAQLDGSERSTTYLNDGQIEVLLTDSDFLSPRIAQLTVENPAPGGGRSATLGFTVGYAQPVVSSVSPASAFIDDQGATLTVRGAGFAPSSVVRWNERDLPTTFDSPTQLHAEATGSLLGQAGNVAITVVTPSPGGGTSLPMSFALVAPQPSLTSISPTEIFAGALPFGLTISGSHFVPQSQVSWNGIVHASSYVNATSLHLDVSSADVASPGTVAIAVTNPAPGGGTSAPATFTVKWLPPHISGLSPTMVAAGSGPFTLSVVGSNFAQGMVVLWNGQSRTTRFVNSTTLTADIVAQDVSAVGTAAVAVRNPATGETTSSLTFTITQLPSPTVTALSPANGVAGGSPMTLLVKGSNYVPGMVVQLVGSLSGGPRPTTYVDANTLAVSISSQDLASATIWVLTVQNPATGQLSNAFNFVVSLTPTPGPTVPVPTGLWQPPSTSVPASENYLYVESDSTEFVGGGHTRLIIGPLFMAPLLPRAAAGVLFQTGTWIGHFATMAGVTQFVPGYYGNAIQYSPLSSASGVGSFDWSSDSGACSSVTGWFVVDSVAYVGTAMTAFSARFEQHCGSTPAALRGEMRWTK